MDVVNRIGSSLLPFTNPRVVAPPGVPGRTGRPNIVVATPMRSGTHLMIDLLLNNLPAYRRRPLYVDLDQCRRQSTAERDLVAMLATDAGHVVKTHVPIGPAPADTLSSHAQDILQEAVVIVVRRERDDVLRSLGRWDRSAADLERYRHELDAFDGFWRDRTRIDVDFRDLFDASAMRDVLEHVSRLSGVRTARRLRLPLAPTHVRRVYANKALTRIVGRRAPRVDTTIHTLKS